MTEADSPSLVAAAALQEAAPPQDIPAVEFVGPPRPHPLRPYVSSAGLAFTGTGAEYFRIWVAHTFLTIVTFGIYSAWAKVRKARWFAQHTSLLGDTFDYHGQPLRILLGRGIALLLFLAYSYSFDWSPSAGLAVLTLLLVLGPVLFGSAQRFRLVNTSWRGLRFGFDAPRARVYAVCVPLLLVWTGGTVWTAMQGSLGGAAILGLVSIALWPAIHAALKTLQHRHARFGGLQFGFPPSFGAFYGLYGRVLGLAVLVFIGVFIVAMILAAALGPGSRNSTGGAIVGMLIGFGAVLCLYIVCWPYFAARMQQMVWSRTTAGELRFHSRMEAGKLAKLVTINMLLVLVTLGLYWPFASVALARYRVQSLHVETPGEWPLVHAPSAADGNAVGDATLDFFDFDLGW